MISRFSIFIGAECIYRTLKAGIELLKFGRMKKLGVDPETARRAEHFPPIFCVQKMSGRSSFRPFYFSLPPRPESQNSAQSMSPAKLFCQVSEFNNIGI